MIIDPKVIILDQFKPSSLSEIEIGLCENILETLIVCVYFTPLSNKVMLQIFRA
jgi:hypothetical protein